MHYGKEGKRVILLINTYSQKLQASRLQSSIKAFRLRSLKTPAILDEVLQFDRLNAFFFFMTHN